MTNFQVYNRNESSRNVLFIYHYIVSGGMKEQEVSRAKKNWMKLKSIILNKNLAHKQKDKKMSLFTKDAHVSEGKIITNYKYKDFMFVQAAPQPIFKELVTFQSDIDATGKWIWEAQEVAAYYFINEYQRFLKIWKNKEKTIGKQPIRVLQLGAGCSGLAGIAITKQLKRNIPEIQVQLILSDGQIENIEYLNLNLQLNGLQKHKNHGIYLKWGTHSVSSNIGAEENYKQTFDLIVVCDCVYFTDFHKELVSQIDYYLSQEGIVILVNPSRGDSMNQFLQLSHFWNYEWKLLDFEQQRFKNQYNKISKLQTFDEQKHKFYFIIMQRKNKQLQTA